jgi:signal transduction histidine kinase
MVTSTTALVLACLALATYEYVTFRKTMVQNLSVLAEVIGGNSMAALAFDDSRAAIEVLSALQAEASVVSASLYDAEGRLFASRPENEVPSPMAVDPEETGYHRFEGSSLFMSKPVVLDRESLGSVRIKANMEEIYVRLRGYAIIVILVLLGCSASAFLMSSRLQRLITEPLLDLTRLSKQVSQEKNYTIRAKKTTDDELGLLMIAFNDMLIEIEKRDNALQHAHDDLERRVEERTEELLIAKEAAEDAARIKSEFLANISHELRTPMHGVLSFATFGINKGQSAKRAKLLDYFQKIHQSGSRLLGLLNDLLDLSKLEAGKTPMEYCSSDFNAILRCVVDEFRSLISDRDIKIMIAGEIQKPLVIDSEKMMQVLRNVISNAVKFSPPGGAISVSVTDDDTHVHATVEDDGVGIPEEDIEVIFDKFIQSGKTKTGAGGTGLGLAICKEIISAHGGKIWAESGRKKGAAFHLQIPRGIRPTARRNDKKKAGTVNDGSGGQQAA